MTKLRMGLMSLAAMGSLAGTPALADSIGLLSQTGLISGRQSFVFALEVTAPGTLSVQLADLNWQGRLDDLTFSLSNGEGLLESMPSGRKTPSAAGAFAQSPAVRLFDVTSPGTYYAYVSGSATGPYSLGLYSLNATLATSAVPLPGAAWLLLSGLGGALGLARRRRAGVALPGGCDRGGSAA